MVQIRINNLKRLREQAEISQEKLARVIDVSKNTIMNWESHSNDIPATKLVALAEFFNCSIDDVMGYRTEEPAQVQ